MIYASIATALFVGVPFVLIVWFLANAGLDFMDYFDGRDDNQ